MDPYAALQVEKWQLEARGEREGVLRVAREQARLTPAGLMLFEVGWYALALNRPKEALEWLVPLDPERGVLRGWAYYWVFLSSAHHRCGNF